MTSIVFFLVEQYRRKAPNCAIEWRLSMSLHVFASPTITNSPFGIMAYMSGIKPSIAGGLSWDDREGESQNTQRLLEDCLYSSSHFFIESTSFVCSSDSPMAIHSSGIISLQVDTSSSLKSNNAWAFSLSELFLSSLISANLIWLRRS